ncbi:MAG: hypothetical protein NT165_03525 [Candidatus Falkowbacteria bacterium]|nr:hypothetical protein [Candidatus Falkowbacteria bacterium]
MDEPPYVLIINPHRQKDEALNTIREEKLSNMNFALTELGKAKGWGQNPRWDLLFEAGFKALVNEEKK